MTSTKPPGPDPAIPRLRPGAAPGADLRRVAREDVDRVLARFEDPDGDRDEDVHQLRTCCKRMRALLLLLPGDTRRLRHRFRDAARAVGGLRDRHVGTRHAAQLGEKALAEAAEKAGSRKTAVKHALKDLRRGRAEIGRWPTADLGQAGLGAGFERTLARCRHELDRALAEPSDHRVHRLRKWVKYHYYQLLVLAPLGPPTLDERVVVMHDLGHVLGEAHDLAVLEEGWPRDSDDQRRRLRNLQARKRRRKRKGLRLAREWLRDRPCSVPGAGSERG